MLLSLRSKLAVTLCPTQVTALRLPRGWRPKAEGPEVIPFDAGSDAADWHAPVEALRNWLEINKPIPSTIEYVLSDHFVRYLLVPWSDQLQDTAEIHALAGIQFESHFGESPAEWIFKTDVTGYGKATVVCAIRKKLVETLEALGATHRMRLTSIQPRWVRLFNKLRNQIANDALLMSLELGQCILAVVKRGSWHSIRTLKLPAEASSSVLEAMVEREFLLQGLDNDVPIYLHASEEVAMPSVQFRHPVMLFRSDESVWESQAVTQATAKEVL